MNLNITTVGKYKMISIQDELNVLSDVSELQYLIDGYINAGIIHIGLVFSNTSYIYSGAIAVLVDCHKKVEAEAEGDFCIIEPNDDIRKIFEILHLTEIFRICNSIDELY